MSFHRAQWLVAFLLPLVLFALGGTVVLSDSPDGEATAHLPADCTDPYEPNNWFDQATPVEFGVEYNAVVCNSDDNDFFRFPLTTGQQITISLYGMEWDSNLDLYGPDQTVLITSTNPGTTTEQIVHTADQAGTYYAMVWGTEDEQPNSYTLRVNSVATPAPCPDPYEPNDVPEEAWSIEPDAPVDSYICHEEDVDYYALPDVSPGQILQIEVDGVSEMAASSPSDLPIDLVLVLFDPNGEEVAFSDAPGTRAEAIIYPAEVGGTYRVGVRANPGTAVLPAPYRLRWTFVLRWEVNTTDDRDDGACTLQHCSLREAIQAANRYFVKHITFRIPTSDPGYYPAGGYWTIQVTSTLPALTAPGLLIDGFSQAGFIGSDPNPAGPEIQIDGSRLGAGSDGLIVEGTKVMIQGLSITGFEHYGIWIQGASNQVLTNTVGLDPLGNPAGNGIGVVLSENASHNLIRGNVIGGNGQHGLLIAGSGSMVNRIERNIIGLDPTGREVRRSNHGWGIVIQDGANANQIGPGNVVSGNDSGGIWITGAGTDQNSVRGNVIGTDKEGNLALGNGGIGVLVSQKARSNFIGGPNDGEGNVISGNLSHGVELRGPGVEGTYILGNIIGLNRLGTTALPNHGDGVYLDNVRRTTVGSPGALSANVISGNMGDGIRIESGRDNVVRGNRIGVNPRGNVDLGNGGDGIEISRGREHRIGGFHTEGNVISGNGRHGILIWESSTAITVTGNYIGTDATGKMAIPNDGSGVIIATGAHDNIIGSTDLFENNIISGNQDNGVHIYGTGTVRNRVLGNYIGTDFTGRVAIPNHLNGVIIDGGAQENEIGGRDTDAGNVIAGNNRLGVAITDVGTDRNKVWGNRIGIGAFSASLPNGSHGIYIAGGAQMNQIGGASSGMANTITGNKGDGIRIEGHNTIRNTISHNSIFKNEGRGIRLLSGGNQGLSPPSVTRATSAGGQYTLEGSTCGKCTVEVFADDADEGEEFLTSVQADASGKYSVPVPRRRRYFTLTATDGIGNTSEFSRDLLPDLEIQALEVTQAIQDLNNSVHLVQNRPTYVRAHVRANSPLGGSVSGVFAVLKVYAVASNGTKVLIARLEPRHPHRLITVRTNPQRGRLDHSFYFELPSRWSRGRMHFVFDLNPGELVPERDLTNNRREATVTFQETRPLDIVMVRVRYESQAAGQKKPTVYLPPLQAAFETPRYTEKTFPLSQIRLWWPVGYAVLPFKHDLTRRAGWEALLDKLNWLRIRSVNTRRNWYGLVDKNIPKLAVAGMGSTRVPVAAGVAFNGRAMAHELGHNFGRAHAPSARDKKGKVIDPHCKDPSGEDTNYPNYKNPQGVPYPRSSIGEFGFDVFSFTPRVYDPASTYDLMSYCWPGWVSPYTYQAIFKKLVIRPGSSAARGTNQEQPYLLINGFVDVEADTGELGFAYVEGRPVGTADAPGEGAYRLELRDATGNVLFTRYFEPQQYIADSDTSEPRRYWIEVLPFPIGTRSIVLLHGEKVLDTRQVSPNPPTVTMDYPNGGEALDGSITIRWHGSDPDGDPLVYTLQYSIDGGGTWHTMAVNLTETSYTVDTSEIGGSDQAKVRVLASDGVNTAADESDGVFSVPRKPPLAGILVPTAGTFFPVGSPIYLKGYGTDIEDGPIEADAQLRWHSDISGDLGSGSSLEVSDLPPGHHTITLTAIDSDGLTGSASVTITVGEWPPVQIFMPAISQE